MSWVNRHIVISIILPDNNSRSHTVALMVEKDQAVYNNKIFPPY